MPVDTWSISDSLGLEDLAVAIVAITILASEVNGSSVRVTSLAYMWNAKMSESNKQHVGQDSWRKQHLPGRPSNIFFNIRLI